MRAVLAMYGIGSVRYLEMCSIVDVLSTVEHWRGSVGDDVCIAADFDIGAELSMSSAFSKLTVTPVLQCSVLTVRYWNRVDSELM